MNYLMALEQFSCFVQEFYRVDFFEESDVVAQVGEERVFSVFRVLDFVAVAECPKTL